MGANPPRLHKSRPGVGLSHIEDPTARRRVSDRVATAKRINAWHRREHRKSCPICDGAPEVRRALENEFLAWRAPKSIAETYRITYEALERHCRAAGLYARRGAKLKNPAYQERLRQAMDLLQSSQPSSENVKGCVAAADEMWYSAGG